MRKRESEDRGTFILSAVDMAKNRRKSDSRVGLTSDELSEQSFTYTCQARKKAQTSSRHDPRSLASAALTTQQHHSHFRLVFVGEQTDDFTREILMRPDRREWEGLPRVWENASESGVFRNGQEVRVPADAQAGPGRVGQFTKLRSASSFVSRSTHPPQHRFARGGAQERLATNSIVDHLLPW